MAFDVNDSGLPPILVLLADHLGYIASSQVLVKGTVQKEQRRASIITCGSQDATAFQLGNQLSCIEPRKLMAGLDALVPSPNFFPQDTFFELFIAITKEIEGNFLQHLQ